MFKNLDIRTIWRGKPGEEGGMTQVLDMIEKGSLSDADLGDGMWLASSSGRKTIYSSYAN
jgi:hypothetical protein